MRVTEAVARALISVGGVLTIVSVTTICVFLVWTVVPLFRGADVGNADARNVEVAAPIRALAIDETGRLAWTLLGDGTVEVLRLDNAERIESRRISATPPACWSYDPESRRLAIGLDDGQVVLAEIGFSSELLRPDGLPPEVAALEPGAAAADGASIVERLANGEWRRTSLWVDVSEPVQVSTDGSGIALIDQAHPPAGPVLVTLTAAGKLSLSSMRRQVNLLTDEETLHVSKVDLPALPPADGAPIALALFGGGDQVLLLWRDGAAARYDARDHGASVVAERLDLLADPKATVTAVGFLLGRRTLIVGDSSGNIAGWFRAQPADAGTLDGIRLERGHFIEGGPGAGAVVALAPSSTTRTFAAAFETGESRLFHMTSEKLLGRARGFEGPADALALSPRGELLVARGGGRIASWSVDCEHPEVSFEALARPVWYESHVGPEHVWQSTGSTDDFEPKLGFVPLVFGTLKSTLYSMLFGAPLALLAALFTSEFLDPRARNAVKSTIEVMASLPSVVLGFLAALVVAPFVQGVLPAMLLAFLTIPLALLAGAYTWQLVPQRIALRASPLVRLGLMCLALPLGLAAAVACGPAFERLLFGGDVEAWLDGRVGSAFGGWAFLAMPVAIAATVLAFGRYVTPWQRRNSREWTRAKCARFDVARFAAACAGSILVATAIAWILSRAGLDPRGSVVGTYVQRNALVVGFVMGFAIVPLIYTLAEDALSSVPEHLRLASLGAGATHWQTAVRVIVPTAASGLFSALMVGLGRAVGETMIVLMAAGNTPVLDWNVFNGFRTLSANLAVELPEAVEGSTHYRTLFLAALVLFAITFAINTAAEVIRQRFRSRAGHL